MHGDLAARNILVGENYTAKISDFGLSKMMYYNQGTKYNIFSSRNNCQHIPMRQNEFCLAGTLILADFFLAIVVIVWFMFGTVLITTNSEATALLTSAVIDTTCFAKTFRFLFRSCSNS
jgi:hypothetical protein